MDEEEERIRFEEEEVTTIHRKTIRTQSTTRSKRQRDAKKASTKTEIALSPFIHGAKNRDSYKSDTPEFSRKPDCVQKLVQDTLNEYKGTELPQIKCSNRVFLGAFDSDEEGSEADDNREEKRTSSGEIQTSKLRVWRFKKTGKKGLDRFRRIVDFVILAQNVFTCRRSVSLNRRDSILFFMDRQAATDTDDGSMEPKFDVNAFKGIGQKTKMVSVKNCLELPPSERTDGHINLMLHTMKTFSHFSNYPQAVQIGLCKRGWYARFESSKVIVKEGSRAEFYYLILSGLAVYREIVVDDMDGNKNEVIPSYLRPGDTLGEKEILTGSERPATVVCKEPVEVLGVDRDTLLDIFKASGGIGSIEFLKSLPEFSDFPLELLQTYHFSMAVHYYRRGAVIAKSSNESEWIYIVRSGSCQVYKAIKDGQKNGQKKDKRVSSAFPAGKTSKHRESSGVVFPNIHKHKNDILKSASTAEINDTTDKKHWKKKVLGLERSHTILPNLNPGKTSLVQSQGGQETKRPSDSNLSEANKTLNKENTSLRLKKKVTHGSPQLTRKKISMSPDALRLSRNDSILLCDTPEAVKHTRHSHLSSASTDSITNVKHPRKNTGSSVDSEISSRNSKNSDELRKHMTGLTESESSIDSTGSMFYVRLGSVSPKGVFGLHPLVYDNMPNLSLVSNGAECILISKQFLKEQMTSVIAQRLRNKLPAYPSSGQLRTALDDQINWENYRDKVVTSVLK